MARVKGSKEKTTRQFLSDFVESLLLAWQPHHGTTKKSCQEIAWHKLPLVKNTTCANK